MQRLLQCPKCKKLMVPRDSRCTHCDAKVFDPYVWIMVAIGVVSMIVGLVIVIFGFTFGPPDPLK